jgi:serine/threonine protein kinase
LFSLGAVLYFMATGHPPFRADGALAVLHRICREPHRPVWQTNKDIPDELSRLIDRLLEKKASRRPATAAAVSAELAAMLSRFQQFGPSRRRLPRWRKSTRQLALIGACAAVLLAATALGVQQYLATIPAAPAPADARHTVEFEFADRFEREYEYAAQFERELQKTHEEMQVSERETLYFSPTDDAWSREVEAIERELSTIESQQDTSPPIQE